jgi:hypothetical protein
MVDNEVVAKHIDAFLDETWIEVNGRKAVIFATVIPHDLGDASASLAAIKRKHGLTPTSEVKWSQQTTLSPQVKADIKRDILRALTQHFSCLICVTEGMDKSRAFTNALRQVHDFARAGKDTHHISSSRAPIERPIDIHVSIHHDDDAFQDRAPVFAELASWTDVTCSGIERANSAFSAGIQYADILAGTFSYVLRVGFGARAKVVTEDYEDTGSAKWPLNALFHVMLRWSVWGDDLLAGVTEEDMQRLSDEGRSWPSEWFFTKCMGKGVRVHGSFSNSEMAIFEQTATYYRGCMH